MPEGIVKYKRGRKQKDGSRIYIIRYKPTWGSEREIRIKESKDSDASFHSGDEISVSGEYGMVTIKNNTLRTSIRGRVQ
jgi:hypothetical protein